MKLNTEMRYDESSSRWLMFNFRDRVLIWVYNNFRYYFSEYVLQTFDDVDQFFYSNF